MRFSKFISYVFHPVFIPLIILFTLFNFTSTLVISNSNNICVKSVYILFILAHKLIENEDKANKVSNIIAIIGLINIPVIRYSVDWWNTLHQPSSIKLDGTSSIHPSMLLTLMLMLLVLLLYCELILLMKYKTEIIRIKKKNIKRI